MEDSDSSRLCQEKESLLVALGNVLYGRIWKKDEAPNLPITNKYNSGVSVVLSSGIRPPIQRGGDGRELPSAASPSAPPTDDAGDARHLKQEPGGEGAVGVPGPWGGTDYTPPHGGLRCRAWGCGASGTHHSRLHLLFTHKLQMTLSSLSFIIFLLSLFTYYLKLKSKL